MPAGKAIVPEEAAAAGGVVFNIQRFSIHDGPGIRTTVFLKGCSLRCGWCSNPESLRQSPEIITRDVKCIKCGRCVQACPREAITLAGDSRIIDWGRCDYCRKCAEACPSGAIEAVGRSMTVGEVMDTVARDAGYYRHAGGGMTISGGEPLAQWEFTLRLLREAKAGGFHTALDTTGNADWEVLERILEFTDLVLYDVKHTCSAAHQKATGVPSERILDNLRRAAARPGIRMWVRHPVIPGFNDSEAHLKKLCRLVLSIKPAVEKISLLPYHRLAEAKYAATGRTYPWKGRSEIGDEKIGRFRNLVQSHGIEVGIGR